MSDDLLVERADSVLYATFNRPEQRNAMTWSMYEGLYSACEQADQDESVRVMVVRGTADAFVAGTDIAQFRGFSSGEDGVDYERRLTRVVDRLSRVRVPTLAAISGPCVGGGLAVAAACDLRVAASSARFGVPIARTLGNCLSIATHALLGSQLGPSRTLDMLLRARFLDAQEAAAAGFLSEVCEPAELDGVVSALTERIRGHAPLTMWAAKESMRRLRHANLPDGEDIVRAVYDSDDFREGVASFLAKRDGVWTGR